MTLNKLKLNYEAVAGSNSPCILIEVKPTIKFVDGKRTNETEGFTYTVVFPDSDFEKENIKISNLNPKVTQADCDKAKTENRKLMVTFTNFIATPYVNHDARISGITCRADDITIVSEKGAKLQ